MSKPFVLALVRANGTRWNVSLSNVREPEAFVGNDGALGFCKRLGKVTPAEAVVIQSDILQEAWFYEGETERKLNVLTLAQTDSKKGNW